MARVEIQIDRAAEEIAAAPGLWAELQEHPWRRQQWMVRNAAKFQQCGFALHVLERSRDCWPHDAAEAHRRACLARAVLCRLPAAQYPGGFLADCEARAHAYRAHAARLLGNLLEAETAFAAAREALERGGGSLDETACVSWLEAELRREQGRFDQALELSHQAARLYRRIGDRERCVEASLLWAEIVEEAGRAREAVALGVSGPHSPGEVDLGGCRGA